MSRYAALFTGEKTAVAAAAKAAYRILLVDDEPNVVRALQRVFRKENYKILTAADGLEALALVERERPQLVISDFRMPGMDGGEFLTRVREQSPDTIRIMLTGHADTAAVMSAIKDGAVYRFILKPWNDDDLRVTVGLALEQHDLLRANRELRQENAAQIQAARSLSRSAGHRSRLAVTLRKRGLLTDAEMEELRELQQQDESATIRLLLRLGAVTEEQIRVVLREDLAIEELSLAGLAIDPGVATLVARDLCERQCVLPIRIEKKVLILAMADPMDLGLIDDLRFTIGLEIRAVVADVADIDRKILEVYGAASAVEAASATDFASDPCEGIEVVLDEEEQRAPADLLRESNDPPAIRLVNAILLEAIRLRASDVHLQPAPGGVAVRYRIDGVLSEKIRIPKSLQMALVSRLKVMAELDISERRLPQDGRITVRTSMRTIDLRISTLPTVQGEKVVLRILDRDGAIHRVEDLGFSPGELRRVRNIVSRPQGIILATGPTGHGKTTTLYSLLRSSATPGRNYVTIEDPVEYSLEMATQVAVRERIGLSFARILRAILRQDPDVILVGEMRDVETAEVAFHAAMTGHLVFSTLHCNSAVATIARLFDLGMKPFVVASALEMVVAQRLVRRLCEHCRVPVEPGDGHRTASALLLGPDFGDGAGGFRAKGCESCQRTGYRGRIGLYEILIPDTNLKHVIAAGANLVDLTRLTQTGGMRSILQDARDKVGQGLTTVEEVLRVIGPQIVE